MRGLLAIALGFALASALAGCVGVVPPAVTIASYAVDTVSYIATGKTTTDHALSGVADEDCVLLRAVVLENPCRPYPTPDSDLAVELETSYGGEDVSTELADADLAAGGRRGPATAVAARRSSRAATLARAEPARTAPAPRYVVVGSFRERANAERARRANASRGAAIVPASVGGRAYYRVVTPAAARTQGAPGWTIAPCHAGAGRSPCLDQAGLMRVRGRAPATALAERATHGDGQLSERPMTSSRAAEIGG
ncbi:MAG: SPOR domain-containing protein [Candidatus Eiseniibacteriota bacterium]